MYKNILSNRKFLFQFILCWAIWSFFHAVFLINLNFDQTFAIVNSLLFNTMIGVLGYEIGFIMQFYFPKKEKVLYVVIISILSAALITYAHFNLMRLFSAQSNSNYFFQIHFILAFVLLMCITTVHILLRTLGDIKADELHKHEIENLNKEAELYNLRQQLQPHFLFNSLNSISALAGSKPEQARDMIQQLSDFLRGTIRKDLNQMIPLKEEISLVQLYFEIEKVRFGHRLQSKIQISLEHENYLVPGLILQPVIENAIKFGLYETLEAVTIAIKSDVINNLLQIVVTNPMEKFATPTKKGTGFGLQAIERRLYLLYLRNDLVATENSENLFTTIVKIPITK